MPTRLVVLALLAALAPSCKSVDCGTGTTERNGACVPASETVGAATCGPFTELHGDKCAPMLTPTMCDPATTQEETDSNGVVTCIGKGGGGCGAKLPCPTPTDGKQTICGQIYDFETDQPFAQPDATGAACAPNATSGPCTLGIKAFDAAAFVGNPTGTQPLTTDPVFIDDCGRYRVAEIAQPVGPFVALAIDDATMGPLGTTNAVGVATVRGANTATKDFDAFIVRGATTASWGATPSLAAGIYAPVYRGHSTGRDLASNVKFTFGPASPPAYPTMTDMNRDYYFTGCPTNRTTLDGTANVTATNGTALVTGANLGEVYAGVGGIPAAAQAQCVWEVHPGAAIPGVVFIQIFRPMNAPGQTCPL
jgi:hypothetical protein